ncbi:wD repeat domain [Orbilia javanica]|uniref:WD repeat domain n=1 Tax=Orbilia javanica TaxID=47235 RepID=A0AAN8MQI4_9PEZI
MAFIPEDNQLMSCSSDGRVIGWDLTTKEQVKNFKALEDPEDPNAKYSVDCAFSPDGKWLVTMQAAKPSTTDKTTRGILWDITTQRPTTFFKPFRSSEQLAFSPDNNHVALIARPNSEGEFKVIIWDIDARKERCTFGTIDSISSSIAFSPDGEQLVLAYETTVELWDVAKGQQVKSFEISTKLQFLGPIAFSTDGEHLALALHNHSIQLWKTTGQHAETFEGHSSTVNAVAFSPDGERLASTSFDSTIRLWDTTRRTETTQQLSRDESQRVQHQKHVQVIAFPYDNKLVATGSYNFTIILWNVATG